MSYLWSNNEEHNMLYYLHFIFLILNIYIYIKVYIELFIKNDTYIFHLQQIYSK